MLHGLMMPGAGFLSQPQGTYYGPSQPMPSAAVYTQTSQPLPYAPMLTNPMRYLGYTIAPLPAASSYMAAANTSSLPKRKRDAAPDLDPASIAAKKSKSGIKCAGCLRDFPPTTDFYGPRTNNNGLYCTGCCNKMRAACKCVWQAARMVIEKAGRKAEVTVADNTHSAIATRAKACGAEAKQSGFCACVEANARRVITAERENAAVQQSPAQILLNTSQPVGAAQQRTPNYNFLLPTPTTHNTTGTAESPILLVDVPELSHSRSPSPVYTPAATSPRRPRLCPAYRRPTLLGLQSFIRPPTSARALRWTTLMKTVCYLRGSR